MSILNNDELDKLLARVPIPLITLKFRDQDGIEICFRIKRSSKLKNVMNVYSVRQNFDLQCYSFFFFGRHLRGHETPDQLGMIEGARIYAILNMKEAWRYIDQIKAEAFFLKEKLITQQIKCDASQIEVRGVLSKLVAESSVLREEMSKLGKNGEDDVAFTKIGTITRDLIDENSSIKEELTRIKKEYCEDVEEDDDEEEEDEDTADMNAGKIVWETLTFMLSRL